MFYVPKPTAPPQQSEQMLVPLKEDPSPFTDATKILPVNNHHELTEELESVRERLLHSEEQLSLKEFELKEKDLTVKQLKGQLFDKECKVRDLNQQLNSKLSQLDEKDRELRKTEEMFKEYGAWRSKLETIETKMREEAEHWKTAAEKLQRENTKL